MTHAQRIGQVLQEAQADPESAIASLVHYADDLHTTAEAYRTKALKQAEDHVADLRYALRLVGSLVAEDL